MTNYNQQLQLALEIATMAHRNVVRRNGGPYGQEHPLRVKHAFEDWLLSSLAENAELIQLYAELTHQEVTATLHIGYGTSDPELTYCFQPKTKE